MNLNISMTLVSKRRSIYSYDKIDYETMLNLDWKTAQVDMGTQDAMDNLEKPQKKQYTCVQIIVETSQNTTRCTDILHVTPKNLTTETLRSHRRTGQEITSPTED